MPARRLLFLAQRFPPDVGGLARSGERIPAALSRLGVEVEVVAWTRRLPPGRLETVKTVPGVVLHRVGLYASVELTMQHTLGVLEWLHAERPFHAVWGHYLFPTGFLAVLFAGQAGLPSTVSARGNDVDQLAFPPGDFARLRWTLERATLVTSVSAELQRKIRVLVGDGARVEVLRNAVDLDTFHPGPADPTLRERLGIAPGETVLGFCGELRQKKGLPFLLDAFREVRRKRPACLLVIGEVRARDQAALDAFAAEHPEDAARLLVTGPMEEPARVAAALRLCDLVLLPSLWEGLPNALLEAMACGRLVLASDAGGIPEVVRPGIDGFIVPRARLHRFGLAANEVLERPEPERARWAAAARERVAGAFGPAQEAEGLSRVLERLMPSAS
ncbi:MAG TPA: glycosyltransferase [Longimicrobium sp.]|nr:glycosyltransferase [Longimicrobium sp.]